MEPEADLEVAAIPPGVGRYPAIERIAIVPITV